MTNAKTMLITGASSGIGRELARIFARRGWRLALAARRGEQLHDLARELHGAYRSEIEVFPVDLSQSVAAQTLIHDAKDHFGRIDTVVANAGSFAGGPIGRGSFAGTEKMLTVNIVATFALIDAAVQLFRDQGSGHVAALSSVAGWKGMAYSGAYSATKAAVEKYMQALRAELKRTPICTTTIFPGYIDTPINAAAKSRPFLISVEDGAQRIAAAIEKQKPTATVPFWPWRLAAPFMKISH